MTSVSCRWRLASILLLAISTACWAQDPIHIGSRLELLLDDHLIESFDNLAPRLHRPRRAERVLVPENPWEGDTLGHVTVFRDGDIFRMYYRGHIKPPGYSWEADQLMCYAQSDDGIHWQKPSLGLFDWEGSKQNNIVYRGKEAAALAPFRDQNPDAFEDALYKSLGGNPPYAMASADGLHWRRLSEKPVLSKPHFGLAYWDPSRKKYVAYVRARHAGFRSIGLSTSPDFIHWSQPKQLDFGDAPKEHLYWNTGLPYFRAPHMYLGFPMRLLEYISPATGKKTDRTDVALLLSRNGFRFDRRYMEAFLRPGLDANNWRSHANMMALGILPTGEGEISLYCTDDFGLPSVALQRLVLRTDGFVSLQASYEGGRFVTRPIVFEGDRLTLNVSTSAAGSVRVEIQDGGGRAIKGYGLDDCEEIYGDAIRRVVRWKGGEDVSSLAGKPVRLRFVMSDADLFAFQFCPKNGE